MSSSHIDKFVIDRVKDTARANLLTVIKDFISLREPRSGSEYTGDCPICQAHGKFAYNDSKHVYKCFSCGDFAGNDPVKFVMTVRNCTYIEAIHHLGRIFSIETESTPLPVIKPQPKGSFCQRMLKDSGLTPDDVRASVFKSGDHESIFQCQTFREGTLNDRNEIVKGDDVIIEYYDLEGFPVTYQKKDFKRNPTGETATYYRVRWQYPEAHLDKDGKAFKYKSPYGAGTPIYIPQKIRTAYSKHERIERLFIQEGEKKAEKACKHGIMSVAISGIQNLGYNGSLPEDLVRIIRTCQVKEVVFLMDSDWNDLSKDKKLTEDIAKRPRNFFFAARNYKDYMRALKNQNIYVEIYIGHTKAHGGDKGIDDLLTNTLRGREDEFLKDLNSYINEKSLDGQYSQLFKITSWTDHKLEEIWGLDNVTKFAEMHREELKELPEFLFGRHKWRFDESGELVFAQPFDDDEKFWDERHFTDKAGNDRVECTYLYVNAINFLQNRGFGRYRLGNGSFNYIHVEAPFVSNIISTDARDFLVQFANLNCNKNVLEMLYKGGVQYLGPDKLSYLNYIQPNFLQPARDCQHFYFRDSCWKVSRDKVEELSYSSISYHVWKERQRDIPTKYVGPLVHFKTREDGTYEYHFTEAGKMCHFLRFLENASNFTWRKSESEIEPSELAENNQHLLSKLCAIGYMAMDVKDPNVSRAVIAMDGKQSEVGESNGRSGKSLVGELMRHITTIAYINGKKRDILEDQFIWNDVTEKTRLVFIDDVLQNFNFEFLFPCITGDWTVNYKGAQRITFPFAISPKLYIPTNHTIKGEGSSYSDRQWVIAFSDYYNQNHKPADDFGQLFFAEWDFEQWNLAWNLVANCIQLYLKFGVIQAPEDRIESRRLRQEITEGFILWADEYFSNTARFGVQISRHAMQDDYFTADPQQRKYVSPNEFKKRFKKYCQYRGYIYNPQMYDPNTGQPYRFDKDGKPVIDDKSGGIEYFTVGKPVEKPAPEPPQPKQEELPF